MLVLGVLLLVGGLAVLRWQQGEVAAMLRPAMGRLAAAARPAGGARRYGERVDPDHRPPLRAGELRGALVGPGRLWSRLEVVERTGSTNADLAAAARAGAGEGLVLAAEHQYAGQGRAGRAWVSAPRAGLAVSVLLRPTVPAPAWGWLPLLAGVALAEAAVALTGVPAALKWPNDLLVGQRKCAGVLAEVAGGAVVLGVGVNVDHTADELPPVTPPATSLALAGARDTDRSALLRALLDRLAEWYGRWGAAGGDPDGCGLRAAYRVWCGSLGEPVRVLLPDGGELSGTAEDVDRVGRLLLSGPAGPRALAAGDVTHLRPG